MTKLKNPLIFKLTLLLCKPITATEAGIVFESVVDASETLYDVAGCFAYTDTELEIVYIEGVKDVNAILNEIYKTLCRLNLLTRPDALNVRIEELS